MNSKHVINWAALVENMSTVISFDGRITFVLKWRKLSSGPYLDSYDVETNLCQELGCLTSQLHSRSDETRFKNSFQRLKHSLMSYHYPVHSFSIKTCLSYFKFTCFWGLGTVMFDLSESIWWFEIIVLFILNAAGLTPVTTSALLCVFNKTFQDTEFYIVVFLTVYCSSESLMM